MNFKRIIAVVMAVCVMGTNLPSVCGKTADNTAITASAADYTEGTYGQLTYKIGYGLYVCITGCDESAESVVIPAEIEGVPVRSIDYNAFMDCINLKEITIPNGVRSIYGDAFNGCTGLTKINIPDSVDFISDRAFMNCTSLTEINIPDSVTSIGDDVFNGTPWLEAKKKENPLFIVGSVLIDGTTCSGDVVIPDNVTNIKKYAFSECSGLTGITIPESVTIIGWGAFSGCTGLTKITIPNGVGCISSSAFEGCTNLKSITIPEGVTKIENDAFSGCTGLTEITIPESVTVVWGGAFKDCTNLKSITIPEGVTKIENDVFKGCTGLTEIIIPDSVTSIGYSAFEGCTNLKSITIPEGVTEIENDVFKGCTGLTEIIIPDSVTSIGYSAFYGCPNLKITISSADLLTADNTGAYSELCVNYPRPKLNYTITESEADKFNIAKSKSVEAEIDYSTIDNNTSAYTFGCLDRLQECKDSKGNIYAIGGYENSITLFSENTDKKPVTIKNEGFTFGSAVIDENDNLYVFWGYDISEDIIEAELEKNTENLVITKYDLNGNILDRCGIPITTSEAQYPFDVGNASMAVKDNVIGCFFNAEWTKSNDGYNHQGSEFAAIDKNTMELIEFSGWEGSHSFGVSLIPTDYGFAGIQRGDATARGINFNSYLVSDNKVESDYLASNGYKLLFSASGQYGTNNNQIDGNATYLHMGGLAKSATTYAVVGKSERVYSSVEYYGDSDLRTYNFDVFLKITDQTLAKTASDLAGEERVDVETGETANYNIVWLTECNETEKAGQVKVVTLADGSYCVLWEKLVNGKFDSIRYVVTDECGNILRHETGIYGARLSDTSVQPIVEDYTLKWAVADKENQSINFYTVDLNNFSQTTTNDMLGDVNGDGMVDSSDASLVLTEYALLSTGKNGTFSESVKKLADLNKDGITDSSDASLILAYYAHVSTGGTDSIEVFLEKQI